MTTSQPRSARYAASVAPPAPVPTTTTSAASRTSAARFVPWMIIGSVDLAEINGRHGELEPLRPRALEAGQRARGRIDVGEVPDEALERLIGGAAQAEPAARPRLEVGQALGR